MSLCAVQTQSSGEGGGRFPLGVAYKLTIAGVLVFVRMSHANSLQVALEDDKIRLLQLGQQRGINGREVLVGVLGCPEVS